MGMSCLCTLCRCGDHVCPQQLAQKLSLQEPGGRGWRHDPEKKKRICQAYQQLPESTLYSGTTYKEDYKILPDVAGPPEPARLESTLECERIPVEKGSTYSRDFVPWPEKDMELCRSKLSRPDGESRNQEDTPDLTLSEFRSLKHYYCPPHCAGAETPERPTNCLIPYKDKFHLGPPKQREAGTVHRPDQPFAKHTNYTLDYLPHKIQPRSMPERKTRESNLPFSSDTTHKKDFPWPPEGYKKPEKGQGANEKSTLKSGDGPMTDQSSNMLDYKDPQVTERMPVRPPKDIFHPPAHRMETETTSKASYPRWKDLPTQPSAKPIEEDRCKPPKSDVRFLVTTYQEDFDGLCAALCPAKTVESYGRRAVEPKYRYLCTGKDHEYYDCGENDLDKETCK